MAKVAMNRMSKGNTFYGRKALGMGLGTRDRTSNRTFSISVFHHRYRDRQKAIFFFAADEKTFFFDEKTLFFDEKTFFLRQDRIDIGRCSVRCFRPNHGRGGQFG